MHRVYLNELESSDALGVSLIQLILADVANVLRVLTRRFGERSPALQAQIQSLSLSQLESLGEALLDFSQPSDLQDWLHSHV